LDKQLADKLEQAITGAQVVRMNLRDAGLPAAGEQPPVVLVDMRHDSTAPAALANLRQTRPRASVIAVVDSGVPLAQVYQAGALGAFGNSPGGQPLAQLTRGLKLALASRNALTASLADAQVRSLPFSEGRFPETFAKLLGPPRSGQCAVFPVLGGQRVIALVYADNGHLNQPIEELDILE